MRSPLWPVLGGLGLLLSGAVAVTAAADNLERDAIVVSISGDAQVDESDVSESDVWYAADALSDAHRQARDLARRGQYPESFEAFEEALKQAPEEPLLWAEYGHWLRRGDALDRAQEALTRAQSLGPALPTVHLDLALLASSRDEDARARAEFERALALRPNHSPTRMAFGRFLRQSDDLAHAAEVLQPATEAGSNSERALALSEYGRILFESGDVAGAVEAFEGAVQRAPALAPLWSRAASTLSQSDESLVQTLALDYAQKGVRLAPGSAYAQRVLGTTYERMGLENEAFRAFEEAVNLDGEHQSARRRLLRMALERESFGLAQRQARALLELDPERAEYHFLAGLVASRAEDVELARTHYHDALSRDPAYAEVAYNLGLLERRAKAFEAAVAAYSRAIEIRPDYAAAFNNRGLVHEDLHRDDLAERDFRSAVELSGPKSAAASNLASLLSRTERYEEATEVYAAALEAGSTSRTTRLRYAVALKRVGRVREAVSQYEAILAEHPKYVSARYNLALAYDALGDEDAARKAYQRALEDGPEHWASRKNLGLLEVRSENHEAGVSLLEEALDMKPEDAETRLGLAEAKYHLGDSDGCIAMSEAVLRLYPTNEVARTWSSRCNET